MLTIKVSPKIPCGSGEKGDVSNSARISENPIQHFVNPHESFPPQKWFQKIITTLADDRELFHAFATLSLSKIV